MKAIGKTQIERASVPNLNEQVSVISSKTIMGSRSQQANAYAIKERMITGSRKTARGTADPNAIRPNRLDLSTPEV